MVSSDEDEQLQEAIRLSVQGEISPPSPGKLAVQAGQHDDHADDGTGEQQRTIDLTADPPTDSTLENVTRQIGGKGVHSATVLSMPASSNGPLKDATMDGGMANGMVGLDRKGMERERLARVSGTQGASQKRRLSTSLTLQEHESPSKKAKPSQDEPRRNASRPNNLSQSSPTKMAPPQNHEVIDLDSPEFNKRLDTSTTVPSTTAEKINTVPYPNGSIKRTWAPGYDRHNDIAIEELLQKDNLKLAVFSSFLWDIDWLLSKLDTKRTHISLVMQAKDEQTQKQYRDESAGIPNLKLRFPSMAGQISCMHSKLMLLSFPNYLRIVVPSANLVPFDWGETGVMENTVFVMDLPRLAEGQNGNGEDPTFFATELLHFMKAAGLEELESQILRFDFSKTERLAFVHTIGGSHFGEDLQSTGHPGLATAIQRLDLQSTSKLEVDFITSSLGSLNLDFISKIYAAATGKCHQRSAGATLGKPILEFFKSKPRTDSAHDKSPIESTLDDARNHFRIYFPTDETVRNSKGGVNNAGTICLQSRWYNAATFPKNLLRDYRSVRSGLLSHNKIILARGVQAASSGAQKSIAWAYIGSANLSESAWGKIVVDRQRKEPKLNCRNWECGVLMRVPVPEQSDSDSDDRDQSCLPGVGVFQRIMEVPCELPGMAYGERKPWFFMA